MRIKIRYPNNVTVIISFVNTWRIIHEFVSLRRRRLQAFLKLSSIFLTFYTIQI